MRITESALRKIVREELSRLSEAGGSPYDGKDDERREARGQMSREEWGSAGGWDRPMAPAGAPKSERYVLNLGPNLSLLPRFQVDGVSLPGTKIQAALQALMPAGVKIKRLGDTSSSVEQVAITAPTFDAYRAARMALDDEGLIPA